MSNNLVIFFGIGRGGRIASEFYKQNLGLKYDTIHLYIDQKKVENKRSNENFDLEKIRVLLGGQNYCIKEKEVEGVLRGIDFSYLKDIYKDEFKSFKNLLRQLYILQKFSSLKEIGSYKNYIFVRDDTLTKLKFTDVESFSKLDSKRPALLVPFKHWHGGVCDRFFIVNNAAIHLFVGRYLHVVGALENGFIASSEKFLLSFINKNKIRLFSTSVSVRRIRMGNHVISDRYWIPLHRPNELFRMIWSFVKFKLVSQ